MIVFTPPPNGSNTCAGIEAYESQRAPASPSFYPFNLGVFVFSLLLWSISCVWFLRNRLEPRMKTVRPLFTNIIMVASNIILSIALSLNLAVPTIPCWFFLATLFIGLAGCAVQFYLILTIYVLESHFFQHVGKYAVLISSNNEETQSIQSYKTSTAVHFNEALISFLKIAIGYKALENLTFEELLTLKKGYIKIAILVCIPPCIPMVILLATLPVYSSCRGCALFVEPFLGFMLMYVVYGIAAARILWVARSSKFADTQGLYYQIGFTLLPASPLSATVIILTIFDPADASFNHQFMYFEWMWQFLMHTFYWWGMVGLNMYKVHQSKKKERSNRIRRSTLPTSGGNILAELDQNPTLRSQFETYAKNHFAVESYYFMRDVRAFKQAFHSKNDIWKMQKMKDLIDIYIKKDSVMEVNVSHEIRHTILDRFQRITSATTLVTLYDLFDSAFSDIGSSILFGLWQTFLTSNPSETQPLRTNNRVVALTTASLRDSSSDM